MGRNRTVNLANFPQFTAINLLSDPGAIGGPKLVPSCAQITIQWNMADGKLAHNVLTGRYTGTFAGSAAQAQTILTALSTGAAATALLSHMGTTTALGSLFLRDINSANQPLIQANGTGAFGTGAGPTLPNEVAIVITAHTALAGRANRGRMYIPNWLTTTVNADNTIAAAVMTDLQAWANTIQNALNASGYQLVIGQPARQAYVGETGTAHPERKAGSVPVTSLFVRDNHFDSQRRRGLK
jgi:hypothetical protein